MESRKSRLEFQMEEKKEKQKKIIIIVAVLAVLCVCAALVGYMMMQQSDDVDNPNAGEPVGTEVQNPDVQTPPEPLVPVVSEENSWMTRLVNSTTLLEEGYVPELVVVNSAGYKFDARAAEDLKAMLQAARDEGLSPMICSSYRSWERQNTLFENQVVKQQNSGLPYEEAYEKAKTVVAFPGTSEHQTGLAADIVATSHQLLDDSQEQTAEQQWLMEHCWEYGFVLRYPKDKSEITGIIYEPWHYRYVGHEVAQYIHENGLCLEEYWQQVEEQEARLAAQNDAPKQYEQG